MLTGKPVLERFTHALPLVHKIALRLLLRLPKSIMLDDVVQAGMIGLFSAAKAYQEKAGVAFGVYATRHIKGAMIDMLRAGDVLPRQARAHQRRVQRMTQKLEHTLGRAPTHVELAAGLKMSVQRLHELLDVTGTALVSTEDFPLETMSDERPDCLTQLLDQERRAVALAAYETLPAQEQQVLSLCYAHDMTLARAGAVMGLSESRVCQIKIEALRHLRRAVARKLN